MQGVVGVVGAEPDGDVCGLRCVYWTGGASRVDVFADKVVDAPLGVMAVCDGFRDDADVVAVALGTRVWLTKGVCPFLCVWGFGLVDS